MSPAIKALQDGNFEGIGENVSAAVGLVKALANETRLMILCLLFEGEKSVSELEQKMLLRQPSVSQHLARLRFEELVNARRDGRTIYYSLGSDEARQIVSLLHALYCAKKT